MFVGYGCYKNGDRFGFYLEDAHAHYIEHEGCCVWFRVPAREYRFEPGEDLSKRVFILPQCLC